MAGKWWKCIRCSELNPPLIKYCTNARCRAPAPWLEKPKPTPLPPSETKPAQPRAPKPAWLIRLSVWLTVLTPIVLGATWFLPPPFNAIIKVVFELVKQIVNM